MATLPIQFPPFISSVSSGGVTLDNTLSGETSNSYCSLDYADNYWAAHYNSASAAQWATLAVPQKIVLLVSACRSLERIRFVVPQTLPNYALRYDRRTGKVIDLNLSRDPVKYYYYQKLQFPRNLDIYYVQPPPGTPMGSLFMRDEPQQGQCEQAMYLLNLDTTAASNRMQGVTLDTFGLGRKQVEQTQQYSSTGNLLSPIAVEILSGLMVKEGRMLRG
jgi:hypothetical protein